MFFTPKLTRARRLGRRGNFVDRRPVVGSNLITTYPDQRSIIESITFFLLGSVGSPPVTLPLNGCRVKLAVCHFFFLFLKKKKKEKKKNKYAASFCSIVSIIIAGVITLRSEVSHRRSFTVKR